MNIFQRVKRKFEMIVTKFSFKINNNKSPKAYIFGIPEFGNIGDQAIAIAEKKFIQNNTRFEPILVEFSQTNIAIKKILDVITEEDLIIIHGGGNLGNLYIREELLKRKVIKNFKKNKIVVFPQSVLYTDTETLKTSRNIFEKHPRLTFFARDTHSFEEMNSIFPNCTVKLVPDIVLSLPIISKTNRKFENVLTVFRNDIEIKNKTVRQSVINAIPSEFNVLQSDTVVDDSVYINSKNREGIFNKKLEEFISADVVITDRLHGMIFSCITSTPCIVFNNSNGKIKYFYQTWLKKYSNIIFLNDFDESSFMKAIFNLEQLKFIDTVNMSNYYQKLKDSINCE